MKHVRPNEVVTRDPLVSPITLGDLRRFVPSLVAQEAHDSRSEKSYGFVSSLDLLVQLRDRGFRIVKATQQKTRDASRREFTKHQVRLRHVDQQVRAFGGGLLPEVILTNSHDGSSAYSIMAGIFRFVCSNGLVVADETWGNVRVPHRKSLVGDVIDATYTVIDNAGTAIERAEAWQRIELQRPEQLALAEAAHAIRFDPDSQLASAILPEQLLHARRPEDRGTNLWATVNRIQENVIRGGQGGMVRAATLEGRRRYTSSREVKGIADDTRINRAIWAMAQKVAEIHGA